MNEVGDITKTQDTYFVIRRKSDGAFVGHEGMTPAIYEARSLFDCEDEDIEDALARVGETDMAAFDWVQVDGRYELTTVGQLDEYVDAVFYEQEENDEDNPEDDA